MLIRRVTPFLWLLFLIALASPLAIAQNTPAPPQPQQPDQTAPDSGGPAGDNGPIALPKRKDQPAETPAQIGRAHV